MDELRQHTEEEQQLIEREYQALINDYLSSNHRQKVEKIEKIYNFTVHRAMELKK